MGTAVVKPPVPASVEQGQCNLALIGQLQKDDWRGKGAVQFVIEDALPEQ